MQSHQVIIAFSIYRGDARVSGGSFNVEHEPHAFIFSSQCGGQFQFESSYSENECVVHIAHIKDGKELFSCQLNTLINRTKKKLKESMLDGNYKLLYNCRFEEIA